MQDSALLPSYKKLIEDGYYEEAYHVLNAIRRRYRHIKGLQLFCDNELKQLPKKAASKNQYFYFKQLPKSSEKSSNFLSFKREDSEHDWYFNEELRSLLEAAWSTESQNSFSLPSCVRRILVIGQETESKLETFKPISHILNFLFWHGGYTIKSLGFKKDISNQAISIGLNSADIVIINDISQIANNHELANTIASPKFKIPVILLVDEKNQFVDNLMQDNSSTLHKVLPYLNIFACYATQKELIEKYGTPKNFYVIGRPIMNFIRRPSKSMRGEKKKTVTIYGSDQMNGKDNFFYQILKDPRSKYYSFKQVRSRHYEDKILQRDFESNNNHDDDHKLDLIARTDIFCLSSDDDDIRLEAIDAYLGGSKLLLPKNTSLRAIFRNLSGIIFYNKLCHNELLNCLDALNDIDYPCIEDIQIVKGKVGLRTFCSKFVKSISDIYRSKEFSRTAAAISELYSHNGNKKICAATHLHDINLLFKLRRHCESLPKTQTSVFVTLEDGKNNSNYKNKIEKIFAGFNDVNIIFIKSHEPDITVFTYILSHIKTKRVNFDVLLKVNSEKSFNYFNTPLTEIQRLEEPFDGLLKSKSQVEDILSILRNDSTALLISKRLSGKNIDNNSFGWNVRSLPAEDNEKDDFFNSKNTWLQGQQEMFWCNAKVLANLLSQNHCKVDKAKNKYTSDYDLSNVTKDSISSLQHKKDEIRELRPISNTCKLILNQFRGIHSGKDIYILCSGPSLDLIDPSFFDGKCTIGVNGIAKSRRVTYSIFKEYSSPLMEQIVLNNSSFVFCSLFKAGNKKEGYVELNRDCFRSPQIIYYDHVENQREKFDLSVLKSTDGKLFVSWSTATTAIHLAYWMGAKNIILVGHDCGQINGKTHIEGYAERKDGSVDAWRGNEQQYIKWLSKIEAQTISLRNFLKQEFGVNVYSINPFVSLSLEGATFTRS